MLGRAPSYRILSRKVPFLTCVLAAGIGPYPDGSLDAVLTIDAAILDAIVAHARRDHPFEACGLVAGPAGSDEAKRLVPMENAARSTTFYEFDSQEYLRVWR